MLCYEDYDFADIFNMDESGYMFRFLPVTTLSRSRDICKGGKHAKDRLTIVLTCSVLGEKLPPIIIGKSKLPRCLRNIDLSKLNVKYWSSSKAWMTTTLFNSYLRELDDYFKKRNRKILLFLDNAPVHLIDPENKLTNIKLKFFPPNLTSVLQPLDAGIIRSLKAYCRKYQILTLLEKNQDKVHVSELAKKMNIFDAIKFLSSAWNDIKPETIQKCFKNCGFSKNTDIAKYDLNEIENQVNELAEIAENIGIQVKI